MARSRAGQSRLWWEKLPDSKLLDLRFSDLDLQIEGSRIEPHISRLYHELAKKNLNFQPHIWISEDWFSVDGIPGIAVPFYVINERLARLEKKMVLEVEGYNERDCIKLLRHEAGHAIDNAFRLRKIRKRQKLFGLSSTPYPDAYSPRAYSRKYVVHLNSWYAQSHPDEDWAETFAVWLNPKSNWKQRYARWPALQKLEMVDEIMQELAGKKPPVQKQSQPGHVQNTRRTLRSYYEEKRSNLGLDQPFYLDPLLAKLFSSESEFRHKKKAAAFIRQERPLIVGMVAKWTGQYKYTIDLMIQEVIRSCQEKKMHLTRSEKETRLDLVGMLTAQTLNYINSGQHKIAM
jgi:hypothetical protein